MSLSVVVFCFIITYLFAVPKEALEIESDDENFISPAKGKIVSLENVEDETFSKKMLGDGFAIDIVDGNIVAPISGTLETVFPSGHAFGIKGADCEILIHVGINTVSLNGEGFEVLVKEGDKVKQGDILVKVDLEKVHSLGKSTMTMVLFTDGKEVNISKINESVNTGDVIYI